MYSKMSTFYSVPAFRAVDGSVPSGQRAARAKSLGTIDERSGNMFDLLDEAAFCIKYEFVSA